MSPGKRSTVPFTPPSAQSPHYPLLFLSVLAAVVATLLAGVRPDAFYSGDPGVKLIATRGALAHPGHPFDVSLPAIDGVPTVHVEPFLAVHDDHAHAVTSPVFPLLSAPLLAAFGLRGLCVLPGLGYLVTVAACGWLAVALRRTTSSLTAMVVAALATPFFFYALEFWEHAPATACAALALLALVRRRYLAAGLAIGVGVLLRPETAWFAMAMVVASPALPERPSLRGVATLVGGALLALAPYELYVIVHFSTLVPPHIGTNSGAVVDGWLASRLLLIRAWFATASASSFWAVAPATIGAVASLGVRKRSDSDRFLWIIFAVTLTATLLSAPNTGGSQWGTRYLLNAYIPVVVLATSLVDQLPLRQPSGVVVLALALVGCLWIDRSGYREIRGAKAIYGRVVDFMRDNTAESSDIVTDVWWLDQIAAAPLAGKQLFYTPVSQTGNDVVRRLSDHTVPVVTVVHSEEDGPNQASWREGTCYFEERRERTSVRRLVLIQLRHRCGFDPAHQP